MKKKILIVTTLMLAFLICLSFININKSLSIYRDNLNTKIYLTVLNPNESLKVELYSVLQKAAEDGTYAKSYIGEHQDSMDSSKSTETIYHWYAASNTAGDDIRNKNNVVFADTCWQMIRTTDTGGVRLLYNGEPEEIEVDGEIRLNCGDTRSSYHLGTVQTTIDASKTTIYAKNYTTSYDGSTTTFTLVDDPNDPNDYKSITINSSNAEATIADIIENYPYFCSNRTGSCTDAQLNKVVSHSTGTKVNVYSSTYQHVIGKSEYNSTTNSHTYVGYMYGTPYPGYEDMDGKIEASFNRTSHGVYSATTTFTDSYLYSKTLNTTGTSSIYELDNPILGSEIPDGDYTGYYTYRSSTTISGEQPYYVVGLDKDQKYFVLRLTADKTVDDYDIVIGDTLIDNNDGTYTIKDGLNSASRITMSDWYNNYNNYVEKYSCGSTSATCTQPKFIISTTKTSYSTINAFFITIATERNGLQLSGNIETIDTKKWYSGYKTTYKDYVYTCGNTDITCTETNLQYITSKQTTFYNYAPNRYFGESVVYENEKYKLQNISYLETVATPTTFSTHHYACLDLGKTECSNVAYIYYYGGEKKMNYLLLDNPQIQNISDALVEMHKINNNDSTIKTMVDQWYKLKLLNTNYESKLDDVIYCNDRSYSTREGASFSESGLNPNGGSIQNKNFYYNTALNENKDLNCVNITDRFSVSNSSAQLKYKIGLISAPEISLMNNNNAKKSPYAYWLATPALTDDAALSYMYHMKNSGVLSTSRVNAALGIRPAISLIKNTKYSQGDGTMTNPYIVDMSN